MEKEMTDKLAEIYFFIQYGKLMPGMIHNINGKITAVDSKLQLAGMKLQMKIKKLSAQKENMSVEEYNSRLAEYEDLLKLVGQVKDPMDELKGMIKNLNDKTFNENSPGIQMIDINGTIKSFADFFMFERRFKHETVSEFELDGNPFIKMEYKDLFFILYAVTSKIVSEFPEGSKDNKIVFSTKNFDDSVELTIISNAHIDAESLKEEHCCTDIYFLNKTLEKYIGYDNSFKCTGDGSEFKIKLLKKYA